MAYLDKDEIYTLYTEAKQEGHEWKRDYPEYERLADNGLIDDLDPNLPEVNDGSLAASLFKLPKRIVNSDLTGRAKAVDRDDAWLSELANMQWEDNIIPNANTQAPFHRKWKDAVRKAAIYGSVPLITIFTDRGNYTGADFIVAQPQDVTLEPGKVSDYDSDVIYWDVYFSKLQLQNMIETAKAEEAESKESGEDGYNKWNVKDLEKILESGGEEERTSEELPDQLEDKAVKRGGYHFCISFQRGVGAPFYMYHKSSKKTVREWTNPDPTGDIPVHYLYCYQDFINPYGIGIVKLAGGTQNVLDYMRQADVLATQLGFRPPIKIAGDVDEVDEESLVYAEEAHWIVGNADVERQEISNGIYTQLPNRMAMYKTSLQQLIPTGDTSISAAAGDPQYSKTPAGVKFQAANLSIDDDDFRDNLYMTYAAKAKSMINTHFANMQGRDLMKLSDEERDILMQAGIEFPVDEEGNPTNELEIIWDEARAEFDFEIDAEMDEDAEQQEKIEQGIKVLELRAANPQQFDADLMADGKRLKVGELLSSLTQMITDNDDIVEEISPEEMEQAAMQEQMMAQQMGQEMAQPQLPAGQMEPEAQDPELQQAAVNVQAVMAEHGVDENTALAMLEAERQGFDPQTIIDYINQRRGNA